MTEKLQSGDVDMVEAVVEKVVKKLREELAANTSPEKVRKTKRSRKPKCKITRRKTKTTVRRSSETGVQYTEKTVEVDEDCERQNEDFNKCNDRYHRHHPRRHHHHDHGFCGKDYGCYGNDDCVYRAYGRYLPRVGQCQIVNTVQPVCGALGCTLAQSNVVACDTRPCWAPDACAGALCSTNFVDYGNASLLPYNERSIYDPSVYLPGSFC